ncbi:MAG: light-harvesting protein [Sphingorhabdus sp.]|nr:light-harvesting protein [Sphingorhabdus sp.]|tara:strand:+ start:384 stop:554 length:171 start_codon:yes stop_codon:yes gene_type:complete
MAEKFDPHDRPSLSGLTESEAREFHKFFSTSFLGFTGFALIVHILTYAFAPWGVGL